MAILTLEGSEKMQDTPKGLASTVLQYFGGPNVTPVLKLEPGVTPPPSIIPAKKPCGGCSGPTVIPSVPGGIVPVPLPPVVNNPATPLSDASESKKNPTYSQLSADGGSTVEITEGVSLSNDWWKYLVGAAVGYFIAKRK